MPVPSSGAPRLRRRLASVAAVLALAAGGSLAGLAVAPAAAAAAPATVTGEPCAPGEGVTVLVDFAPASDAAEIGCATGSQASIGTAATAAGFDLTASASGFLTGIDGVDPVALYGANAFWSLWLSTTDGQPTGPAGETWTSAQVGIDGGPVAVDSAVAFVINPDYLVEPAPEPRLTIAELINGAVPTTTPTSSTETTPSTSETSTTDTTPSTSETSTTDTTPSTSETSTTDTTPSTSETSTTDTTPSTTDTSTSETTTGTTDSTPPTTGVTTEPTPPTTDTSPTTSGTTPVAGARDVLLFPASYGPSEGERTRAAAQWLAAQVEADNGLLSGDYGLTADAIIGLSAAGVGPAAIEQAALALAGSGEAYIGAPADSAAKAGAIAKTALALEIAGVDPTTFPTPAGDRDLLAELRAALTPTGQFGPNDFPLVHSLAVLALLRTEAGVPADAVTWLIAAQCADPASPNVGGYGFDATAPCDAVDADSTAISVQAVAAATGMLDRPVDAALTWLEGNQQDDGGWTAGFGGSNSNSTGLAVQALGTLEPAGLDGAEFIAGNQVICPSLDAGAFTEADLGAVAYDATAAADGLEFGIDDATADQWKRATAQAVLGLGVPTLDSITAEGAQELPALTCTAPVTPTSEPTSSDNSTSQSAGPTSTPVTTTPVTTTTVAVTRGSTTKTVIAVGPLPARPLASTGVSSSTLPLAGAGAAVIVVGGGLLLIGRRQRGGHQS